MSKHPKPTNGGMRTPDLLNSPEGEQSGNSKGFLYLIPCLLGDVPIGLGIPVFNLDIIGTVSEFIVENIREARRFLIKCNIATPIDQIVFHLLNEHTNMNDIASYLDGAVQGKNMGLLSDAGCPSIADPGASIVLLAHRKNIKVVPLTGPSSIFMALMASGLNGQKFSFHGYLPKQKEDRVKKLKMIEINAEKENSSHIFIEAPYRNDSLLKDILEVCRQETVLCIASDISLGSEQIHTRTISEWKSKNMVLNNHPTVFIIGGKSI